MFAWELPLRFPSCGGPTVRLSDRSEIPPQQYSITDSNSHFEQRCSTQRQCCCKSKQPRSSIWASVHAGALICGGGQARRAKTSVRAPLHGLHRPRQVRCTHRRLCEFFSSARVSATASASKDRLEPGRSHVFSLARARMSAGEVGLNVCSSGLTTRLVSRHRCECAIAYELQQPPQCELHACGIKL